MIDKTDPTNRDSVPAMLTPGEFVLNKEASTLFAPQIEAMNNKGLALRQARNMGGMIPQGYNTGGLITFLKDKEGYKDKAYQDSAGVWTIGYGRTGDVKPGDTTTRSAEDTWLDGRAAEELDAVKSFGTKHGYDWNDGQLNALASFRYNGGQGMIDQLTADGTRDNDTIQSKFGLYNKVTNPDTGKKEFVQGLQNRRDAELGLWGGTTPTETPAAEPSGAAPETTQALQGFPEEVAGTVEDTVTNAAVQAFQPPPPIQAPPLQAKAPGPEYIPSVTEGSFVPSQPLPGEESNPMNQNSLWNTGGPVQHLNKGGRGGAGKKKVWDSETQKYIWVKPDDIRVEQEKALAAQAPVSNNQKKPLAFAQAAQPNVTHMGPRQYKAPYQQSANLPLNGLMQFDRAPSDFAPPGPYTFSQSGQSPQIPAPFETGPAASAPPHHPQLPSQVPENLPPVPGSDEALLQSSSQQVELQEQEAPPNIGAPPPAPAQMNIPNNLQPGAQNLRHGAQWDTPQAQPMTVPNQAPVGGAVPPVVATPNVDALRGEHRAMNEGRRDLYDPRDPRNRLPGEGVHTPDPRLAEPGAGYGGNAGVPGLEVEPPKTGGGRGSWHQDREELLSTLPDVTLPQTERQSTALEGRYQQDVDQAQEDLDGAIEKGDAKAITKASNDLATSQGRLTEQEEEVARSESAAKYAEEAARFAEIRRQNAASDEKLVALNEAKKNVTDPAVQAQIDAQITALEEGKVEEVAPDPVAQTEVVKDPRQEGTAAQKWSANKKAGDTLGEDTIKVADAVETETTSEDREVASNLDPVATEAAGANAPAGVVAAAKDSLKKAFGGLFDQDEFARAALMFAGAMLTGASPGAALAFAGQGYIQRIDAKASSKQKEISTLVSGGKYTPSSIAKYKKTGNYTDLALAEDPAITYRTGKTETFMVGGKKVKGMEVKDKETGDTVFVSADGRVIDLLSAQKYEPKLDTSTPEGQAHRKSIRDTAVKRFEEVRAIDDAAGEDGQTWTKIPPQQAADEFYKFATDLGLDPGSDEAIQIQTEAYRSAIKEAKNSDGKIKPNRLRPYLDSAVIKHKTGAPELFLTQSGKQTPVKNVMAMSNRIQNIAREHNANQDQIWSVLMSEWTNPTIVSPDDKAKFLNQEAGETSAFYDWAMSRLANF